MNNTIHIVVELVAQEGKFDEMKDIFSELASATREEKGVISYSFIEDENRKNTLLSVEEWQDEESEKKHWDTPHLKSALKKANEVFASEPIVHKGKKII
ncbi:putative quinol monooxygenase [Sediminitomix flava]|nr:putative quinol monooxygenase [Sediminitomix flava]